jgi:hypothetical protein
MRALFPYALKTAVLMGVGGLVDSNQCARLIASGSPWDDGRNLHGCQQSFRYQLSVQRGVPHASA